MGGSAKKIVPTVGRGLLAGATGGISEFARQDPFGAQVGNLNPVANIAKGLLPSWATGYGGGTPNIGGSGPFQLDPNQVIQNKSDILNLGKQQYADTLGAIDTNQTAQTQRAKDLFGQMLPDIAENAQAAHLYDSTGYGQEVARQQSGLASQFASEGANQRLQALQGRQGFETGALQRGFSLEDFFNQANVAKTIGAQMAPAPPSGKQNFGTVASGIGALSPWGRVAQLGKAAGGGKQKSEFDGLV